MSAHQLVLLHGQPGSSADWQGVTARLDPDLAAVAVDRPGYGVNPEPAGDFAVGARSVLDDLDRRDIARAVLVGHSYGGGVALATAQLAPQRVTALVLVASVGPGCTNGWDRLLAAPVAGEVCALAAWWLTPRLARARLLRIERLRGRPLDLDEMVNWQVWGDARHHHGAMWRTFLVEQRALVRSLHGLVDGLPTIAAPTLVLADPHDPLIPVVTPRALAARLPNARLQLIDDAAHHLPRRAPAEVAGAINGFLRSLD